MSTEREYVIVSDEDDSLNGYRCKHGVNVGNAWGADLMCHWCESGTEPPPAQRFTVESVFDPDAPAKVLYTIKDNGVRIIDFYDQAPGLAHGMALIYCGELNEFISPSSTNFGAL